MRRAIRSAKLPTPPCGHTDGLIEAAALGLLVPAEHRTFEQRLATCATCRANYELSASLTASLQQLIPAEEASLEAEAAGASAFVADFRARRTADERRHVAAPETIAGGAIPARLPSRGGTLARAGRLMNVASGLAAALLLLVLVGGFWFLGPGQGRWGLPGGQAPRPIATATQAFPLLPLVPGGIPTNCAGITPTFTRGPLSGVVGQSPFLVSGFARSQATILLGSATEPQKDPHIPYGWRWELTWAAQPGYTGKVTITGANMSGGERLWFQATNGARQSAVLDPRGLGTHPVTIDGQTWKSGTFMVFVPRGGCYVLQASGPGVGWITTFAAGNPNEPVATAQPAP